MPSFDFSIPFTYLTLSLCTLPVNREKIAGSLTKSSLLVVLWVFIGILVINLSMPDWETIAPVITRQGCISVHDAPTSFARNSPEQGAGAGRSSVRTW